MTRGRVLAIDDEEDLLALVGDLLGRAGFAVTLAPGSDEAVRAAVTYVSGMTDRFACQTAIAQLGWDPSRLPRGVGTPE